MRIRVVLILFFASALAAACGSNTSPASPTTPITAGTAPTRVNGCQTIASAGSYMLAADIGTPGATGGTCLTISANDVTIDCAHHTINGYLAISGTARLSVMNCTMTGIAQVVGVTNDTISNSVISDVVNIQDSSNVTLDHNQITPAGGHPAAVVYLLNSQRNRVTGNTIDGHYHGNDLSGHGNDAPGPDDGVVLLNGTADLVDSNTIQNVFDAGIEAIDTLDGSTISNNTISHAIAAGISSYWCTHWETNTVSGNVVTDSIAAIWIIHIAGPSCAPFPETAFWFTNNTISGNSLRSPLNGPQMTGLDVSMSGTVTSNVVRGNDVGSEKIELNPQQGFSDAGGNICGAGSSISC